MSENEKNETQPPLTIAMVVDTSGNRGNGTSNSALQWAQELERQGHHVRLVGIGAPEYPGARQSCAVGQLGGEEAADAVRRAERHAVSQGVRWCGRGAYLHAVPFRPACLQGRQTDGHRRYGRLPRAAGERHVFRGAFEICARHRLVHLLAVRHMAVPQDRPCACADRIGCEPAALAWIQVEAACHLQRLRIAVHAEAAAQGGRAVAGAVPYRRVGTTDQ